MIDKIKIKAGIDTNDNEADSLINLLISEAKSFIEMHTNRKMFFTENMSRTIYGLIGTSWLLPYWDVQSVSSLKEITNTGDVVIDFEFELSGVNSILHGNFTESDYKIVFDIGYNDADLPNGIELILTDYVIWKLKEAKKDLIGLSQSTFTSSGSNNTHVYRNMRNELIEALEPFKKLC